MKSRSARKSARNARFLNRASWLSSGVRTFCFVLALTAASAAQSENVFARISALDTVGTWADDERYGDVRVWSRYFGFDHLTWSMTVDWVWIDPDTSNAEVLAQVPLPDCENRIVRQGAVLADAAQTDFGGSIEITVKLGEFAAEYEIGGPGDVRITQCR